ncbi:hypothetical protein HPP92_003968 [Vanilla planifolia]|uniref:Uncharacterized protein n=1 Tax=Vanilla planifolia TaxID=51239 RepID=A0A835S9D3_VANPL|nr:hypothetical protein HPP92_003968 [Vanilla planifolia]
MATSPSVTLLLVVFFISLIAFLSAYLYDKRRSRRLSELAAVDPSSLLEPADETALPSKPLSHLLNGIGEVEKEMGEDGKKKKRGRKKRSQSLADAGCHESEAKKEGRKERSFPTLFLRMLALRRGRSSYSTMAL